MGRLATQVAATATHADNLPSPEKLPTVSLFDALLPRRISSISSHKREPLGDKAPSVAYTDIKRGKDGKMVMVRHKTKGRIFDNGGEVTTEDVKKAVKTSNADKKEQKNEDGEKAWTAEEDAKLKAMKAENKTWAEIAADLGRPKHELQTRFKATKDDGAAAGGGGQKKEGNTGENKKDDKKTDKKDEAADDTGGDFTAEDDAKIKELLASNTAYKKIAEALGRKLDKVFKDHITKLKDETGDATKGNDTKEGSNSKQEKKDDEEADKKEELKKDEKIVEKPKAEKKSSNDKSKRQDRTPSKDDRKPTSKVGSARSHRSEAKFTMKEWVTLQEDDLFSFAELQLLSEIIMKDSGMSWLRVASLFLDKTGRRVHPDDIADKFNEMAAMGRKSS